MNNTVEERREFVIFRLCGGSEKDKLTLSFCNKGDFTDKDKVNEKVWFREWAQTLDYEDIDHDTPKLFRQVMPE